MPREKEIIPRESFFQTRNATERKIKMPREEI